MSRRSTRLTKVPELKFRNISSRDIRNIEKEFSDREEREKREEEEQYRTKKEKIGVCVCRGDIVLKTSYSSQFNPMSGPLIIGPGSRNQFTRVKHQECFCEKCGLLYNAGVVKKRR